MNAVASHDVLTIVNGPEDGTEFPLTNRTVSLGADPACPVNIRLDGTVLPLHGRIHAVADGYRIRAAHGARVLVDGRRAGVVRSRVLRHGDIVRIGETDLALSCSPGGLAERSRGLQLEHDAVWAARAAVGVTISSIRRGVSVASSAIRFAKRHPFWIATAVGVLAYWRMPEVRGAVESAIAHIRSAF